jgi:ABC-2 type transport system permease protein
MTAATASFWRQLRFERKLFWRNPSAAFFNFLLPLLFLFLVASLYPRGSDQLDAVVPGIAGMSIMATTFSALAFNVTFLREQGILKRMRGTPTPIPAYLGGMLGSAVVNAVLQVALVVAIGHFIYGVGWPHDPLSVAAFTAAGVVAFASLGVAFSHVIPNFDSAAAYVNIVFLPLILISGVFFPTDLVPRPLQVIAEALPLAHVIDGLQGAIVAGAGVAHNLTAMAVVLAWAVAGVVLAVRGFRWE